MDDAKPKTARFIVRGGEKRPANELPGHLALALRLENVGMLLGAGASVSAGGKTMQQLWEAFKSANSKAVEWLRTNSFIADKDDTPNIEELLSLLAIAERDLKRRRADDGDTTKQSLALKEAVIDAALLDKTLWAGRGSKASQQILGPYLRLLARLQGSRQPGQSAPWLFTTNYDLSVEWAAETLGIHVVNGFSGLHDRRFQPSAFDLSLLNTRGVGESRFGSYNLNLAKMHGSLNWVLRKDGDAIELPCDSVKSLIDKGSTSLLPDVVLIQPTTAKYVDSIGFIYGELVRRFLEFLAQPNTTLIVSGYGFKDEHVNRLLASGLLNPTLQMIIYFPEWASPDEDIQNGFLQHLRTLALPRIIICGGGGGAFFDAMTNDLPDPAMVDELSPEAKRLLSQIAKGLPPQEEASA